MPHSPIRSLPLRRRPGLTARVVDLLSQISMRRRERAQLAQLDPHLLRDIGLDAKAAQTECAKPFWRS